MYIFVLQTVYSFTRCLDKFSDKDVVFTKGFAYTFPGKSCLEWIPHGYRHSFLIRHPAQIMRSLYKMATSHPDDPGIYCS